MKRLSPVKGPSPHYRQIWRLVDGAVRDAFENHPNYLTDAGKRSARLSIIKRVTGALTGYVEQASTQGRSGSSPAAVIGRGLLLRRPGAVADAAPKSVRLSRIQTARGETGTSPRAQSQGERE